MYVYIRRILIKKVDKPNVCAFHDNNNNNNSNVPQVFHRNTLFYFNALMHTNFVNVYKITFNS